MWLSNLRRLCMKRPPVAALPRLLHSSRPFCHLTSPARASSPLVTSSLLPGLTNTSKVTNPPTPYHKRSLSVRTGSVESVIQELASQPIHSITLEDLYESSKVVNDELLISRAQFLYKGKACPPSTLPLPSFPWFTRVPIIISVCASLSF